MELIKFTILLIVSIPTLTEYACSFHLNNRVKRFQNGRTDFRNDIDYEAHLQIKYPNGLRTTCTGSIIDDMFILTAAHCVVYPNTKQIVEAIIEVRAGITDLNDPYNIFRLVEKVYVPSMYYFNEHEPKETIGDIAILKLNCKLGIGINKKLKPLQLPSQETNYANINQYVGINKAIFSGFGAYQAKVIGVDSNKKPVYDKRTPSKLQYAFASVSHIDNCYGIKDHYYQMCAISQTNGFTYGGTCSGDSGGALVIVNGVTAVGVLSYGAGDCSSNTSVFTRISSFLGFIKAARADGLNYNAARTAGLYYRDALGQKSIARKVYKFDQRTSTYYHRFCIR